MNLEFPKRSLGFVDAECSHCFACCEHLPLRGFQAEVAETQGEVELKGSHSKWDLSNNLDRKLALDP